MARTMKVEKGYLLTSSMATFGFQHPLLILFRYRCHLLAMFEVKTNNCAVLVCSMGRYACKVVFDSSDC